VPEAADGHDQQAQGLEAASIGDIPSSGGQREGSVTEPVPDEVQREEETMYVSAIAMDSETQQQGRDLQQVLQLFRETTTSLSKCVL
jgi:hypothetical protein